MKSILFTSVFLAFFMTACSQTTQETKKVKHNHNKNSMSSANKLNAKVVNEEDPICHMKTGDFLKDTLSYNKKTYGFCSTYCKDEFKKNPKKYVK